MPADFAGSVRAFARALLVAVGAVAVLAAQAKPAKVDAAGLYKARCQMCHLASGDSKVKNMSFTDGIWVHGSDVEQVSAVIKDGVKGTAMLPFKGKLSDAEVEALAQFVRAFDTKLQPGRQ